jgi:hypothetical protein
MPAAAHLLAGTELLGVDVKALRYGCDGRIIIGGLEVRPFSFLL